MGLKMFFRSCSLEDIDRYNERDKCVVVPNPKIFQIVELKEFGCFVIGKIKYPDCLNFEGTKILIWKDTNIESIRNLDVIDPHFSNSVLSPFVRFKPTQGGYNAAMEFVRTMMNIYDRNRDNKRLNKEILKKYSLIKKGIYTLRECKQENSIKGFCSDKCKYFGYGKGYVICCGNDMGGIREDINLLDYILPY